ncbi:MAG: hypothetical protein ACR2KX_11185 [Chitinophagaceae bacterium]
MMCLFIPSIADGKPKCEIHPLGIGGNADPVRLVFNSATGPAINASIAAWIYAGGAHHTGYSQNLTREHMEDFASFANIEYVVIGKNTNLYQLKNELRME